MTTTFKDVATGIRNALKANGAIAALVGERISRGTDGADGGYPLIRMQQQADSDDLETLGGRVFQFFYIGVIAVSTDADEADEISAALDSVLQRGSLTINTNKHGSTSRKGSIWYQEGAGNTYTHSGGIYRIGVKV